MKSFLQFLLDIAIGFARQIASLIVLAVTLCMLAGGIALAFKMVDYSSWFLILIIILALPFFGFLGVFYQGLISWINPGWEGIQGGYDGLHWESDDH